MGRKLDLFFKNWPTVQEDKNMHTCLRPLQNLSNTLFMLPPFSMDMILVWSSSLIQIRKFFSLLCLRQSRVNRWFLRPALRHLQLLQFANKLFFFSRSWQCSKCLQCQACHGP